MLSFRIIISVFVAFRKKVMRFFSQAKKISSGCFLPKESIFSFFKGSISLEAILVAPLFLLFIASLMMSLEMIRLQTNVFEALHQGESVSFATLNDVSEKVAEEYISSKDLYDLCLDGGAAGLNFDNKSSIHENGIIDLSVSYSMKPLVRWIPGSKFLIADSVYGHAFSGYERSGGFIGDIGNEEYVYITESGTRYHRSSTCQYIRVRPMAIGKESLEKARNNDGGKYYPCEVCRPRKEGVLFITPEGDRFHSDKNCSSLKRTVKVVTLKEALDNGYFPCSKCG